MADWGNIAISGVGGYNMASGLISNISAGMAQNAMSKLQSSALKSQARLGLLRAWRESGYLNEVYGQEVWNTYDNAAIFQGKQKAAWAGSGFMEMTAADKALVRNTRDRADREASGLNRTAFSQALESQRSALVEAARLEGLAKASRIQGRNALTQGWISGIGSALGAFANMAAQSYAYNGKQTGDVSPVMSGSQLAKNHVDWASKNAPWSNFGGIY